MDLHTLKTRSMDGLKQDLKDVTNQLRTLQFKLTSNQVKRVHEVRQLKKTIARIQTLLHTHSTNT